MKAVIYHEFRGAIGIENVADPSPPDAGVVVRVEATGLCLSDWHGWQGHDADITLPHVPGHELAGVIEACGPRVTRWRVGDRVTVPFVGGCGTCGPCQQGQQQVCDRQFQPGFTHWGSFARFVAIDYADGNLVEIPESMDFTAAASLGCRFVTAFRAVVDQGRATGGQWVSIHGCGGVGLSAIMIGKALGARLIAIDIDPAKLDLAASLGAEHTVDARAVDHVPDRVRGLSNGGVHVSIDALGSARTCFEAVSGLRKRGRHVQVGLLTGAERHAAVPMDRVVADELEIVGSHGIQAHRYPALLGMIEAGQLNPKALLGRRITLSEAPQELATMDRFSSVGVTVIDRLVD